MEKNNGHMECSLEDNGIYEPPLGVGKRGLAAVSWLMSFA